MRYKLYLNRLLFVVILITGGAFWFPVMAAPTVKTFNTTTSTSAYGNTRTTLSQKPTNRAMTRASSMRIGNSTPKSIPATTSNQDSTGASTSKVTGYAAPARLPGAHANVFKGLGQKISTNQTSTPTSTGTTPDLEQRVSRMESEITTKQDILNPGDGIDIIGDTISLTTDIIALPERVDEMAQSIDDLSEQTQSYMETNYYTREEIDNVIGQLVHPNVANEFDPGFLLKP